MLKKRIIGIVIVKNNIVVQSYGFKKYLPVGSVNITLEYLDNWGIDEIILLDISATKNKSTTVLSDLKNHVKKCFVPLTYGGGLTSIEQVSLAFKSGADKVSFNNAFLHHPNIIRQTSLEYGAQSCVISVDVVKIKDNYKVYDYSEGTMTDLKIEDALQKIQDIGAGEILVNSVDRDGSYQGYDKELTNYFNTTKIPLILAGGARVASHFSDLFTSTNINALAAGNMFHFVEHSVTKLKSIISSELIREDDIVNYSEHKFEEDQRIIKLSDETLKDLMYQRLADKEI